MEYYLAVFKSRTQTLRFYERLRGLGVPCDVVNTPRQASLGCGLSVKFPVSYLSHVRRMISSENYYSYGGLFRVNGNTVRPV